MFKKRGGNKHDETEVVKNKKFYLELRKKRERKAITTKTDREKWQQGRKRRTESTGYYYYYYYYLCATCYVKLIDQSCRNHVCFNVLGVCASDQLGRCMSHPTGFTSKGGVRPSCETASRGFAVRPAQQPHATCWVILQRDVYASTRSIYCYATSLLAGNKKNKELYAQDKNVEKGYCAISRCNKVWTARSLGTASGEILWDAISWREVFTYIRAVRWCVHRPVGTIASR